MIHSRDDKIIIYSETFTIVDHFYFRDHLVIYTFFCIFSGNDYHEDGDRIYTLSNGCTIITH